MNVRSFPWLLTQALLGVLLLTGGDCSQARKQSVAKMNEGVGYAQQRRYPEAVEAFERAGALDPTNAQAFYNLALVHMQMGKYERAKEDLKRAIAVDDSVAAYHEKLGGVLMKLKDWKGAKEAFEKAIEKNPKLFKAYFRLARVLEKLDDDQGALQRYTEAIEKGPRFIPAYQSLGRLYADLGYLDEAAQVLQEGLKVAPEGSDDEARLHHLLGTVYQQQKKYDQAIEQFRAALAINPGMSDALFSLGWTYALQGNQEEAKRYLKKFLNAGNAPPHYVKAARDKLYELGGEGI